MKIWCDSCNKTEASLFCSADEAALCNGCDLRVHRANKLASKHQRLSLLQLSSSSNPLKCDICQDNKGLLFCHQDRKILCADCDVSIHTKTELTKKHVRFVLTGAKLSLLSSMVSASSHQPSTHQFNPNPQSTDSITITHDVNNQLNSGEADCCTSSISEYLIETLPGWQVEDLLDSSSLDPVGFYKDSGEDDLQLLDPDLERRIDSYGNSGIKLPQTAAFNSGIFSVNEIEGMKGDLSNKDFMKMTDDGFTVPQISPQQSVASKRSRPFDNW